MENKNKNKANARAAQWLATWFGAGNIPFAPGTMGSIAALPFAWVIQSQFGASGLILSSLLLFVAGVWASDVYMVSKGTDHDPKQIVVDEVMGQWLILAALPLTIKGYLFGLVLFRVFDILKPWPISFFDRNIHGGVGVMFDDFLAAIYPAIIIGILAVISVFTGHIELFTQVYDWLSGSGYEPTVIMKSPHDI